MTGPEDSHSSTRPISVAELLARNGTIGAPPVGGRRRRRRGNSDSVTVAELTGEIPILREHEVPDVDETEATRTIPVVADEPVAASTNGVVDHVDGVETESVDDVETESVDDVETESVDDVETESVDDVETESVDDVETESVDDVETNPSTTSTMSTTNPSTTTTSTKMSTTITPTRSPTTPPTSSSATPTTTPWTSSRPRRVGRNTPPASDASRQRFTVPSR